ncbi:MAG: lipopolysaccharide transport system permease protein [Sulfurimonas sp.]|jgi:lipopolysaccharide transport system permease protein|uniref:ABC transporter permease n=1 Tax=Sulfurimonas sp. TaxID=2022749 RepID=UPI0039E2FD49
MKRNIILAFDFAKRDFKQKYLGTGLGQLWYILSPIITIFIYTVIFSDFMKMKLSIIDNSYSYSIYLVPGILAWTTFSTIIIRLNNSFEEKAGLIKKINVPMFVFQLSILITESSLFILSILLSLGFLLLVDHSISMTFLWMLPVMLMQVIFAFSIGVIFSLFTVFFKDLKEAIPIIIQLWFWMSPIIYMKEMIANKYPLILVFNPFFYFVEIYQNIFVYSRAPSLESLIIIAAMTSSSFIIAVYLYKKMISTIKDIV